MLEHIHSSPIYFVTVDDFTSIQDEIKTCLKKVEFKIDDEHDPSHSLSNGYDEDIMEKHSFKKTNAEIYKHLVLYCKSLDGDALDILETSYKNKTFRRRSWLTLSKNGNYTRSHTHSGIDICGYYHYHTNRHDGDIYFQTPNKGLEMGQCYNHKAKQWHHSPNLGKLMLFPGWVPYGVTQNLTNNHRISLSFNIQLMK